MSEEEEEETPEPAQKGARKIKGPMKGSGGGKQGETNPAECQQQ